MKNVSRALSVLLLIIILMSINACLKTSPSRYYYQIRTDGQEMKHPGFNRILFIAPVDIASFYENYRIVFRESAYEINHYLYHLWYKKPSQMIRENMMDFFASSRLFDKATIRMTDGDPDYILHCQTHCIEELYQDDGNWSRLAMDWILSDFHSGRELLRHHFDKRKQIRGKRVLDLVRSLSSILNEELITFSQKIADHVEDKTAK